VRGRDFNIDGSPNHASWILPIVAKNAGQRNADILFASMMPVQLVTALWHFS